ncbi:MAG: hypothetical protein SF029_01980 [bacterium]|nr:hypothetical protein [bacterium]
MLSRPLVWIGGLTVLVIAGLLVLSAVLTPGSVNPAYAAAERFMSAAGAGNDAQASALLGNDLQAYVAENCPGGSVSACIDAYTPPEWGGLIAAVYRRSIPVGRAYDVLLFATYEEGVGFSGVCIYHRVEEVAEDDWRVTAWSGFLHCEEEEADLQELRQPDAVNRAP